MHKNVEIAKINHECFGAAHRILHCYIRFMFKKYKLGFFDQSLSPFCPSYDKYISHTISALLLSREAFENNKDKITYAATNCKEIDSLIKRFVFKKYNIKIIYNNKFRSSKKLFFGVFKINIILFLKEILLDLRKVKNNIYFTKSNKICNNETYLILSHIYKNKKYLSPYRLFPNKLMKHLKAGNINSINMLPNSIGLSLIDKLQNSLIIFFKCLIKLIRNRDLSLSSIEFIILFYYRRIYKDKIKRFILKNNIKAIVSAYMDRIYEPIYFEVSRELRLKYFLYDYSIGYPIKNCNYLRYHPDVRKYADIIFYNSNFRLEQYKKAAAFLNNKNLFLPHTCAQVIYRNIHKTRNNDSLEKYKVGIVDNVFSDDLLINYDDIYTLFKLFKRLNIDLQLIMQTKRGKTIEILKDLDIKNYSLSDEKGDLSKLNNTDLIVSIGWQSAALKSAFMFDRPLFFYTKNGYPYSEHIFSFEKNKNKEMNQYCKFLWFNQKTFKKNIEEYFINKEFSLKVKNNSSKLLNDIGFCKLDLDYCFKEYFN